MKIKTDNCPTHGDFQALMMAGRWTPCPQCSEARIKELEAEDMERDRASRLTHLSNICGIPAKMRGASFKTFRTGTPEKEQALKSFVQFGVRFADVAQVGGKLIVLGTTGTGKTHLACALISSLVQNGIACRYAEANHIALEVRDTYASGSNRTELEVLNIYAGFDLLVLDEVGVGRGNDHEKRIVADVLSMRHNDNKPTIVISNLARQQFMEAVGDRIWSRLHENGRFLVMNWEDHRIVRAAS